MLKKIDLYCRAAQLSLAAFLGMTSLAHAVVPHIATGYYHSLALQADGSVWAWGNNNAGQLGDGTKHYQPSPVPVTGLGKDVVALGAGHSFSIALKADGSVWVWGYNRYGQLGDGTKVSQALPQRLLLLGSKVIAITAGRDFALALKADGSVWAWGYNGRNQLGDGSADYWKLSPVQILAPDSGIALLMAGDSHTLVLKQEGGTWAFGDPSWGQLGGRDLNWDTVTTHKTAPGINVLGLERGSGVVALAAGYFHSLALKKDGSVWGWGNNWNGQVGNNSTDTKLSSPQQILPPGSRVMALAAGAYHSLALKSDGSVWAWGRNNVGQLGDGSTVDKRSPVQILPPDSGVIAIAAAGDHTLALKSDGSLWEWGDMILRELGNQATASAKLIPTRVPDFSLSAGKP